MAIREALQRKALPSRTFPVRIQDDTEAIEALANAEQAGDEDRIKAARGALDACYEWLQITALSPNAWEALVKAHPPTGEQIKADPKAWVDQDAFVPALLEACIDGEETAADWQDYLQTGPMSVGEVTELINAVWVLNDRSPGPFLGKGWTQTGS